MKKLLTVIILTATIFTMSACSSSIVTNATDSEKEQTMFEWHKVDSDHYVLVDKETGVCYLVYEGDYSNEIIVLLNADGTPQIWESK